MLSTLDDAFSYIESFLNFERNTGVVRTYRLDRMEYLLDMFDRPEKSYSTIHVAGSKGKGSTSLFIASILKEAGFKTGLYASPHVVTYRERITCAGEFFSDDLILSCARNIQDAIEAVPADEFPGKEPPTTFELLTLLGFLTFRAARCSWAVIETGIGGRLDATNTVDPDATVITPIELEHTDILGSTLALIAGEKAGIIKPGVPLFLSRQPGEALEVFIDVCSSRKSELHRIDENLRTFTVQAGLRGTSTAFSFLDGFRIDSRLQMHGDFQAENAALASLAVHSLFPDLPAGIVVKGLERAKLFGRMELIHENPPIMIDAAHTPSSVARLIASFRKIFPSGGVLVFGSVLGKNAEGMAAVCAPEFETVVVSTPGTFKKSDPESVFAHFKALNRNTVLAREPDKALAIALSAVKESRPVLVTGSFYMISEIRKIVNDTEVFRKLQEHAHDIVTQ